MNQFSLSRFHNFGQLAEEEGAVLSNLGESPRQIGRDRVLRSAGDPVDAVFLLVDGWVTSSVPVGPDGRRQIVRLHLPGDMLGTPSMVLTHAAETLTAVSRSTVRRVSLEALGSLFYRYPRLAALMFLAVQQERIFLMDRIASLGRTAAGPRLAAFLLHIYDRLRVNEPEHPPEFRMPITQIAIADMIGLTPVHVNRVFRDLEGEQLITRAKRVVRLNKIDALRSFAGLPDRQWVFDPAWLQPST